MGEGNCGTDHAKCFKCGYYYHPVYNIAALMNCVCGEGWTMCMLCAEIPAFYNKQKELVETSAYRSLEPFDKLVH